MPDDPVARALATIERPEAVPPDFADELWHRLERELATKRSLGARTPWLRAAIAAAVAALVAIGLLSLPSANESTVTTKPDKTTTTSTSVATTVPGVGAAPTTAPIRGSSNDARVPTLPGATTTSTSATPAVAGADRLAYVNGGLWIAPIDGSAPPREIIPDSEGVNWPDWSPDGRELVVMLADGIVRVRDDGSGRRQITSDDRDGFPSWSPDGTTIAFERTLGGCLTSVCDAEIWLVDADGTNERRLSTGQYPSWSPDGRSLLVSDPPNGVCQTTYQFSCHGDLYVIDIESGARRALGVRGAFAHWSPDGAGIVFETGEGANGDVVIIDADGSRARTLTPAATDEGQPYWASDGRIVYAATPGQQGGAAAIYVMDADGANVRYLADGTNPSVRRTA